jgi:hypothetical protein
MTHTEALREIAEDVYMDLGSGHLDEVYHRAMEVDLRARGIEYDSERGTEMGRKWGVTNYPVSGAARSGGRKLG